MASVKPIPDGFHTVTPHITVKGAADAIEFYTKAFGAQELSRMPGPDGQTLMHAMIRIGDSFIMLNDEFPDWNCFGPNAIGGTAVTINLYVEDTDAVFKQAVDAGATAKMEPADMFWGDRYAKVSDPFGHEWSIATHIEDLTAEQIQERGKAMFSASS